MADYYPLLVRAISGLAQNTGEARKVVYDRARGALLKQLRSVDPPLPEGEIIRERQSLEEAIRRIEAEKKAESPPDEAVSEPEAPIAAATVSAGTASAVSGASGKPESTAPEGAGEGEPDKTAASKIISPRPTAASHAAASAAADDRKDAHADSAASSTDDEVAAARDGDTVSAATDQRPVLGKGKVTGRDARPRLPTDRDERERPPIAKIAGLVLLAIAVISGGIYVALNRDTLFGTGPAQTASAPAPAPAEAQKTGEQPKSEDRVAQAGGGDAARRTAPAPQRPATTSQRAVLFEETAGAAQGLQSYEGTVTWRTETFNAGPGLPPDIGIRADIQIPERRMGVTFTLRRNTDQALPASHTIEISFNLPQDFAYGGITNVPGIRVKQTESAQGVPLAGLSVRVNPTFFLVGLSAVATDRQRNVQLLQTRPWIDIPIVYTNNKRAIIAFEKGPAGDQAFKDAFAAWGELLPVEAPAPAVVVPPPAQ
ncbi:MAG: hypothetical protein B7Z15_04005 [Rhizobiales bacterium 32-66-8]|nr:MAG: hypothetical protein B7Z15_04005 [Rhizobiales bacterium 32-66-8]